MEIVIFRSGVGFVLEADPLEVVRLVATRAGYDDVDVEPSPGVVKITASSTGRDPYVANGATTSEAAERFLDGLDIVKFGRMIAA